MFEKELKKHKKQLYTHSIYQAIDSIERLRLFMETHVFAVWDFMSLVKRLQYEFTCSNLPWVPPVDARSARFINEIVLYEETDKDRWGTPCSHLEMYLAAMREVGANTSTIEDVIVAINRGTPWKKALENKAVPEAARRFVTETLTIATEGTLEEVASYFLFGREDAIPEMFSALLKRWKIDPQDVPALTYYLERHIELDGNEHGPAAESLLRQCIGRCENKKERALVKAKKAIESRIKLWEGVEHSILKKFTITSDTES